MIHRLQEWLFKHALALLYLIFRILSVVITTFSSDLQSRVSLSQTCQIPFDCFLNQSKYSQSASLPDSVNNSECHSLHLMPHNKILIPAAVIGTAVVSVGHQAYVLILVHIAITDVCFVIFIVCKIGAGFAVARFLFLIRFHFFSYRADYKQTFTFPGISLLYSYYSSKSWFCQSLCLISNPAFFLPSFQDTLSPLLLFFSLSYSPIASLIICASVLQASDFPQIC